VASSRSLRNNITVLAPLTPAAMVSVDELDGLRVTDPVLRAEPIGSGPIGSAGFCLRWVGGPVGPASRGGLSTGFEVTLDKSNPGPGRVGVGERVAVMGSS
jgi:hypothetical protein